MSATTVFPAPRSPFAAALFLLAALLAGVGSAAAQTGPTLLLQVGLFDVFGDDEATEVGAEYTARPRAFGLTPALGAAYTSDDTFLLYAGLRREVGLGSRGILTPGFAFSYWNRGDGEDLGHALEFRSSLELAYRVGTHDRVGLTVYHVSNAGLSETNPGANSLLLGWRRVLGR